MGVGATVSLGWRMGVKKSGPCVGIVKSTGAGGVLPVKLEVQLTFTHASGMLSESDGAVAE